MPLLTEVFSLKYRLTIIALVAASQPAAGQLPTSGGQLQQIPLAPLPPRTVPDVRVERPAVAPTAADAGPAFRVDTLRISGATAFSESELLAVTGFKPGASLNLGDLRSLAARITDFYSARGYFVAQAYLPAQAVADGTVTIAVIEGRYGKVAIDNSSRLSNAAVARKLQGLDPGDTVRNAPLERRLLLLSDTPGIAVKSTLAPGTEVGTSDLTVAVQPGDRLFGSVDADNAGNRYTGYFRLGGSLALNNPFGIGDQVQLRALVSDGGLTYFRGAYQAALFGGTIGVAYARPRLPAAPGVHKSRRPWFGRHRQRLRQLSAGAFVRRKFERVGRGRFQILP